MKLLRLALVNYKRMLKDKGKMVFMVIMPLAVILGTYFAASKGAESDTLNNTKVAFNVMDRGSYGREMVKYLGIRDNIFTNKYAKAKKLLEDNDVSAIYNIPEDFTNKISSGEKPVIEAVKVKKGNALSSLEMNMEDYMNKRIKEQLLLSKGLIDNKKELDKEYIKTRIQAKEDSMSDGASLTLMLLIYFIILSANTIGGELQEQKRQKILKRAITTANRGYEIIGGLYLGMFLVMLTSNIFILLLSKVIIGYSLKMLPLIMLNICLAILFSISLGLLVTRIFENPTISSLMLTIITVATFMLSALGVSEGSIREIPWILQNAAKFAPQYWLLDSLNKVKIFPNAFVVLLMAAAMFTAGNFRLRNYINRG